MILPTGKADNKNFSRIPIEIPVGRAATFAKCKMTGHCVNSTTTFQKFLYYGANLTTIGGPWYFWKGICVSKAHKPVTFPGNPIFTKVY